MNQVKISVCIPVYNAEKTIERCIGSIMRQTFQDFEIIAVNDGSFDRSLELLKKIQSEDGRLRIIDKENKGVSAARNDALNSAAGEFVMFVDGDDHIREDYLETYYNALLNSKADIVMGGCTQTDLLTKASKKILPPETGDITGSVWKYLSMNVRCFGYICSKIIRRSLIEDHHIRFDETMYSQEDLNFNMDVYRYARKIEAIDDTGYIYEYTGSKRKPDMIGYIRNQMKLLEICRTKNVTDEEIFRNIRNRLESYVFGYLLNSKNLQTSLDDLKKVNGLSEEMKNDKIHNEKSCVCWLFAHSHDSLIKAHFSLRGLIKKAAGRG